MQKGWEDRGKSFVHGFKDQRKHCQNYTEKNNTLKKASFPDKRISFAF